MQANIFCYDNDYPSYLCIDRELNLRIYQKQGYTYMIMTIVSLSYL